MKQESVRNTELFKQVLKSNAMRNLINNENNNKLKVNYDI